MNGNTNSVSFQFGSVRGSNPAQQSDFAHLFTGKNNCFGVLELRHHFAY